MAKRGKRMDFEGMVADSEPDTFSQETPNGSERWPQGGYNFQPDYSGGLAHSAPAGRPRRGNSWNE